MDEGTREGGPAVAGQSDAADRTPEEIRRDIEETRAELGDTVEALAAKTDVKGQAKAKADEIKQSAQARKDELLSKAKSATPDSAGNAARSAAGAAQRNRIPLAIAGAFVGGLLLGRITSR